MKYKAYFCDLYSFVLVALIILFQTGTTAYKPSPTVSPIKEQPSNNPLQFVRPQYQPFLPQPSPAITTSPPKWISKPNIPGEVSRHGNVVKDPAEGGGDVAGWAGGTQSYEIIDLKTLRHDRKERASAENGGGGGRRALPLTWFREQGQAVPRFAFITSICVCVCVCVRIMLRIRVNGCITCFFLFFKPISIKISRYTSTELEYLFPSSTLIIMLHNSKPNNACQSPLDCRISSIPALAPSLPETSLNFRRQSKTNRTLLFFGHFSPRIRTVYTYIHAHIHTHTYQVLGTISLCAARSLRTSRRGAQWQSHFRRIFRSSVCTCVCMSIGDRSSYSEVRVRPARLCLSCDN